MEEEIKQRLKVEAGFSEADFNQLTDERIPLQHILTQLDIYRRGIAKTILERPARVGDGILKLTDAEVEAAAAFFDRNKDSFKLKKFVPASGAASRMFKFLITFLKEFNPENESINAYINRKKASDLTIFLAGLEKFPFFEAVVDLLKKEFADFPSWDSGTKKYFFIKVLLDPEYFNFCGKPKGILPFHKYPNHIATPIEEHLKESVHYAASNGVASLHFTVSDDHQQEFESVIRAVKEFPEKQSGISIDTEFSFQDKSTNTLAVDMQHNPLRDENARLVLRPGGHGALLRNLNTLDADIVFIKNIDNVTQNHLDTIATYKKALAGKLLELQSQVFDFLRQIKSGSVSDSQIPEILSFAQQKLNLQEADGFSKYTIENKLLSLTQLLNRPIRVCGMVRNEGEPGGGPFWVRDPKGNVSLQIVETSQVDTKNQQQLSILQASTHFNPVDIVCGIKDFEGKAFDLARFINPDSGFIVKKNKNGADLKSYELPGLWNGAMANWITVFVEVPLLTFNPVKTVNDLLKSAHQPQ